ncbi:MAG: family 10 glycosylhydrolase [Muribaculaceae bacterium]|nr:family 10 glycosylhydrolase [Muribaculaceae bacterium]
MQRFALKILFILSLILLFSQNSFAENPPKREFRGVWFTTGFGIDWPSNSGTSNQATQKAELDKYITALDGLNINTICFQVRSMSDAMYTSRLKQIDANEIEIPWSSYISGKRGTSPGWDPLEYVITECHKRGIEVYAWFNPFRWANNGNESTWSAAYDTEVKSKGWLMSNGSYIVLNPGIPEVRQHITNVCKDILTNYRIEGFIFDDYFYPNGGTVENSTAPDYTLWKNSGTTLSIGDWRRENVDKTVASIYNMIQETRPEVRLVAGPSPLTGASASKFGVTMWPNGYDNQYDILYSDPLSWMDKRIVDMMATQIYWHRDHKKAPYNTLTDWWYSLAKHFDLHNCVSLNVYDFETSMGSNQAELGNTTAHYDEHVANIKASREYAAKYGVKSTGVNFYSTHFLVNIKSGYNYEAHGQYLRDNCFQRKSINPEIHWKNTHTYDAVNNLAYSNGKLSWTATSVPSGAHKLTTIRYTVYAIPNSVNYETATTDDGFDGEYLQGVTYDPSYTLASDKKSGYWYAVCVFDGFGNEHAPAIYNYTGGASAKATLTTPSNGGSAKWDQTFSWSAESGATYHLQISEHENFSNILIDKPKLTDNSISINLESLVEGKTYYWKVTTQESGKIATDSEIFTFNISSLTDAPLAQLESPSNGASVSNTTTFTWSNADEHVTSYTFQIATDANFSNIINSQDMGKASNGTNSVNFYINNLTAGTYYWRVISKGRVYYDTPSEVYTFIVPTLPSIEISLSSPENGHTVDGTTQHFEWSDIEDATYLFEIATDEKFAHVIVSKKLSTNSYDINVENITYSPIYYWRVTAYKTDYKDTSSETRTFLNNSEFETIEGLCIERLWNYSKNYNSNDDNNYAFPSQLGKDQRSMTTFNGNVYISYRESASNLHLLEFNGKTGEYIRTIDLSGDCITGQYGANCIFTDDAGHLCVSNMGTSSSNPLTVCTVDITTGATTQVFTYSNLPSARIDYVNVTGDITATGAQIWGAVSSAASGNNNYVYRWTRNGNAWTDEYTIINDFYPVDGVVGSAPWVLPISSTQFLVDGSSNHPTLYTFKAKGNATYIDGFDSNTSLTPTNVSAVGMAQVTVGNYPLFIYSNETSVGAGYNFNIVHNPSSFDFSKMEKYWTIPKNRLGDENHTYGLNSIASIKNEDGSATVFVYAPNNGLAAFRISLPKIEISLNSPADNTVFEDDFDFSWNGVEGASYTLEISKTATFEKTEYTATTTATSYNSSNFNFASETQYFWRVKASHPNYTANTSEVRQFTSPVKQLAIDNLTITELWDYNISKSNFPSQLNADNMRSMTAYNNNVYVVKRTNSTSCSILEFNGSTGNYVNAIALTGDCYKSSSGTALTYPCNTIFVDNDGHLCVSNMTTNTSTDPLTVCTVDLNTGATTRVFQSSVTASMRFDYANASGDVTKTGGQIWAATSSGGTTNHNYIYRWTRKSDGSWSSEYTIANKFYPTTGAIGYAPWVIPTSSNEFIIDGASNYPTLYTFEASGNATYVSGFDSNTELKPKAVASEGMNQITLGKYPLFIYSNENHEGGGYDFNIVHLPNSTNFAEMEQLWTVPDVNFGKTNHGYYLNSIAPIKNLDNSATIFLYAPKNGLAAYRISLPEMNLLLTSPANNEIVEKGFDFTWKGIAGSKYTIEISESESFNNIAFSATTTDNFFSSTNFDLDGSAKYYWRVKAENENFTTTTSSVGQFATAALPSISVNLLLPYETEQTISEFNFSWEALDGETAIDGATYRIEISETESFDKIFYSATTNNKIYSSKNIPLELNSKVYYWRVTASCKGYNTTTSEVRLFKSPTILNPTLYYPYNNLTFDKDFLFIALKSYIKINGVKDYADNSILEISKTEDFSEIYFQLSDQDKWVEMEGNNGNICLQYTMPISYLFNGTYYWRVRAYKSGYNEQISPIRKFIVEGQSDSFGSEEGNYKVERENNSDYAPYEYNKNDKLYYTLTNLWIRNSEKNDIGQSASNKNYRGLCTRHDYNGDQNGKDLIWVACHNGTLEKYDANTGEHIGTLLIDENIEKSTYPCNDVFVDAGGNLCIMNLKNLTNKLQIAAINPQNGNITHSITLTIDNQRIDHARIVGNFILGEAYILATNNATNVYRWELDNGELVGNTYKLNTISSFYPSSKYVTTLGTATRIYPIDKDYFYTDGQGSAFTLYKFNEAGTNASLISSFSAYASDNGINPSGNYGNGGTFFLHDNIPFIVYNHSSFDNSKVANYKFNIASVSELTEWGHISKYFSIPNDNIGTLIQDGGDYGMLVDYLQYDGQTGEPKSNYTSKISRASSSYDRTNIYIYVPGNGMAAYSLNSYKHIVTGAEEVEVQNISIKTTQGEITFGCEVDNARIYTLSGLLINNIENASSIEKPIGKGVYILQLTTNGVTTTHKIVI